MPEELPIRLEAGTQNAAGLAGLLAGVRFVLEQGGERLQPGLVMQLAAVHQDAIHIP